MIPTMIVFGLALGRWWRTCLAAAAVVWPAILLASGVFDPSWRSAWPLLGAGLLGAANAGVGVAVHQVALLTVRRLVPRRGSERPLRR